MDAIKQKENLALLRENCPLEFVAFWLRAGTDLTFDQIASLEWQHFKEDGSRWIIDGPTVKAIVTPRAVVELAPFRKESGPVFWQKRSGAGGIAPYREWQKKLSNFKRMTGLDADEFRKQLSPPAVMNRRP